MTNTDFEPWYRQFWPWFIIALPLTAVLGSAVTIWIAVTNKTLLVSESYYQEGQSINHQLLQDQLAKDANLVVSILFSGKNQLLSVHLSGDILLPDSLKLKLTSPFDPQQDVHFQLKRINQHLYQSSYSGNSAGRFYLSILPPAGKWRINQEIQLTAEQPVRISLEKTDSH